VLSTTPRSLDRRCQLFGSNGRERMIIKLRSLMATLVWARQGGGCPAATAIKKRRLHGESRRAEPADGDYLRPPLAGGSSSSSFTSRHTISRSRGGTSRRIVKPPSLCENTEPILCQNGLAGFPLSSVFGIKE
jgi:hypothetical protein